MGKNTTVTLRGEEVFSVGTFNGDAYTEKDLDAMVDAFQTLKGRLDPPVKLGHNDSQAQAKAFQREDGKPALGWVENLRRSGQKLVADFVQVPGQVADWIQEGRFKKKSAEIYWNFKENGKTFPRVLKAVALLGADIPANRSIASLSALYDDEGREYHLAEFAAAEDMPMMPRKKMPGNMPDDDMPDDDEDMMDKGKRKKMPREMPDDMPVATLEEVEQELSEFGEKLAGATKGRVGAPAIRQFLAEIRTKVKGLMGRKDNAHEDSNPGTEGASADAIASLSMLPQQTADASVDASAGSTKEVDKRMSELEELNKKYTELETKFQTFAEKAEAAEQKAADAEAARVAAVAEAKSYADKLAAVETTLAEEKKARRLTELRTVAAEFGHIPGTPADKADRLYRLEAADPKLYEEQVAEWKALDAQIGAGDLFRQASYSQDAPAGSAIARFDGEVKKLQEQGKSVADATVAVASAQPRLYAEYQAEHERRARRKGGD